MQIKPKMGGQERLRIFVKGDRDLIDSLLARPAGGGRLERGLPELIEEMHNGSIKLDLIHEPCGHSELLWQQLEGLSFPEELRRHGLADDFVEAQFQSRLLAEPVDLVVLSIQPEVTQALWQKRPEGYLICPPPRWEQDWSAEQQQWFRDHFEPVGRLGVEQYKEHFRPLFQHLKEQLGVHVIVLGCSSYDPDDLTHRYYGRAETQSERALQLNLALYQISTLDGLSVVDVDRLVAELGGREHVAEAFRYSTRAYEEILKEFLRVVEDIGFFEKRPLLMQIGQRRHENGH